MHESGAEVRTLLSGRSAKSAERACAAGMQPAADERALLSDPVLNVFAAVRPLARRRDVNVIEHPFRGELLDLVPVDVVEAA